MHDLNDWQHDQDVTDASQRDAARRAYCVIALTAATMMVELTAGFWTCSMALLADGWHMATHVGALAIAAFAYYLTQRYAHDLRSTFGAGKIATLGGFTSALSWASYRGHPSNSIGYHLQSPAGRYRQH